MGQCKKLLQIIFQTRIIRTMISMTDNGSRYGPSELYVSGSLRDWTCVSGLSSIKAVTLLLNGAQDEAQDVAMQPFFDNIEKVKWVTLDGAAHFAHVDQREKYMQHLRTFLLS